MPGSLPRKPSSTPSRPGFNNNTSRQTPNSTKRNTSILSFFQKTDGPPQATSRQPRITQFASPTGPSPRTTSSSTNTKRTTGGVNRGRTPVVRRESSNIGSAANGSLFLEDRRRATTGRGDDGWERSRSRSRTPDDFWGEGEDGAGEEDEERYNENGSAVKRRRTGDSSSLSVVEDEGDRKGEDNEMEGVEDKSKSHPKPKAKTSGPFIDESDSEEDLDAFREVDVKETVTSATDELKSNTDGPDQSTPDTPPLARKNT